MHGALPEDFDLDEWAAVDEPGRRRSPLRPELAESTYHVRRASGDASWLLAGAEALDDLERLCRTSCGFATLDNVATGAQHDSMPSFLLSETLKYLFLLFSGEDSFVHRRNYVFSTEAHLFPVQARVTLLTPCAPTLPASP